MDGGTQKPTRGLAVGTLLLALAGCAGTSPGTDSTQLESEPVTTSAVTQDSADPVVRTTTSTVAPTTTGPEVSSESPDIAIEYLDAHELDGTLSDLDEMLGDLDSSLVQEEGELFND